MLTYFKPFSRQLPNGKWISRFYTYTSGEANSIHQENFLDIELNTKEEANKNAVNYCLKQGYILEN